MINKDKTMEYDELEKHTTTDVWNTHHPLPKNYRIELRNSYSGDGKKKLLILNPRSKKIIQEGLWKGLKKPALYTPSFYKIDTTSKQIWVEDEEDSHIGFFARENKDSLWRLYKGPVLWPKCYGLNEIIETAEKKFRAPFVMPDLEGEKEYYKTLLGKIETGNYLEKNRKIKR